MRSIGHNSSKYERTLDVTATLCRRETSSIQPQGKLGPLELCHLVLDQIFRKEHLQWMIGISLSPNFPTHLRRCNSVRWPNTLHNVLDLYPIYHPISAVPNETLTKVSLEPRLHAALKHYPTGRQAFLRPQSGVAAQWRSTVPDHLAASFVYSGSEHWMISLEQWFEVCVDQWCENI